MHIIADCWENQFRAHDLSDCDQRRHVEAQVDALLTATDEDTLLNSKSVTSQKKYNLWN
jgi:hypothetical protein